MHGRGSLYANDHRPNPSLVFLHRDQHGKVRGATLRDTRHRSVFRPCLGNKLTAWFVVGDLAGADRVAAVESPIDALSYYSLFGCRGGSLAVVSCAGASVPRELMLRALDRGQAFVVALDRDPAGQRGVQKTRDETADWAGFKLSSDCPKLKDWNDDLVAVASASALPCSKKLPLSDNERRPSYPDSGRLFLALRGPRRLVSRHAALHWKLRRLSAVTELSLTNLVFNSTKPNPPSTLPGTRSRYEPRHLSGDYRTLRRAIKARHRALAEAVVRRPETSFRASRIAVSTHCFSAPRSSSPRSGLLSSKASTSAVM